MKKLKNTMFVKTIKNLKNYQEFSNKILRLKLDHATKLKIRLLVQLFDKTNMLI